MEARTEAKARFTQATVDFEAGRYREALRGFEHAARQVPSAELWFNIGRAHEELGELEAALKAFQLYLRDSVDPPDRVEVEARLARLREALEAQTAAFAAATSAALLRIVAEPQGARVFLDDASIGTAPISRWLSLAPGGYSLRVEHPGRVPAVARLELERGVVTVAEAVLVRQRAAPPAGSRRLWTWVALGVAGACLGASGGLALAHALGDGDRTLAAGRDALLGTGLAAGMLGALLYMIEGAHEAREPPGP